MSASTVNQWRIFCTTENTFVYWYLPSTNTTGPSMCCNNTDHTVNTSSISIINTISNNVVIVQEEFVPTGNNYIVQGYSFVANANSITTKTISWPIPVNILSSNYNTTSSQSGDVINFISNPITIGYNTSNVNIGDTIINCNSTVMSHILVGYELIITDGTNTNFLDIITQIGNSTVTVNAAATNAFTAGAAIQIQRRFIKNVTVGISAVYHPGEDKIGSSYVPANTQLTVVYKNNNSTNNTVIFEIHYLF